MNFIWDFSTIENNKQSFLEKLIILFVALQVAVDLLTTISVKLLGISISIGMIARFGFLALAALYLFIYGSKKIRIAAILMTVMFAVQLIFTVYVMDGSLFTNVRYYLRTAVFPYSILAFYNMFTCSASHERVIELFWELLKILNTLVFTIGVVFILSIVTKTAFSMYGTEKYRTGISGWFLSGNEISSSMIILLTVPIINYINKQSYFNLTTLCIQVFTIACLGTKASLIIFVILLLIILAYVLYSAVKRKGSIVGTGILFAVIIISCICYRQLPAVKNILWQADLKNTITLYSSQTEESQIPEEIANRHASSAFYDDNSYFGSVKMLINEENVHVSGYFYPKYFDLGHPSFISKYIVFTDNDGERFEFPLNDSYVRNTANERETEFSSAFSGINGKFASEFLQIDMSYSVSMKIYIDGIEKEYPLDHGLSVSQSSFEKKIMLRKNGIIFVSNNPHYIPKAENNIDQSIITEEKPNVSFINVWLSGRSARLSTFLEDTDITIPRAVFGTGYVINYNGGDISGFEMDFIEIALTFGVLGFILYFAVYFFCILNGSWMLIKKVKINIFMYPLPVLLFIAIGLSGASAFMAGHAMLTPSVSINIALITVMYYCYCRLVNKGIYIDIKDKIRNSYKDENNN